MLIYEFSGTVVPVRRGRRRQVVKALDCGSSTRGFKSPRLPHYYRKLRKHPPDGSFLDARMAVPGLLRALPKTYVSRNSGMRCLNAAEKAEIRNSNYQRDNFIEMQAHIYLPIADQESA